MLEWVSVSQTEVLAFLTGLSPSIALSIRAVWRYCNKRSDQRHEYQLRSLEAQQSVVETGTRHGFDVQTGPMGYTVTRQAILGMTEPHNPTQDPSGTT